MREPLKIKIFILGILVFGAIDPGYPAAVGAPADSISDLRILIDVSGSMKKNDPANIRVPAVKLLIHLLPPDSRAGIWLFAAEPALLVPVGSVNDAWKTLALKSASAIHSQGLFTHIEGALKAAMQDWENPGETSRKSIILLTDGVVDVARDQAVNVASRSAILDRLIPRLKRLAVRVHTIALSENADHDLLHRLSQGTGGLNQYVQAAGELERAFLTMFKQAVPANRVPLVDNKFSIDRGIEEFSVLCFRGRGTQATRLVSPAQKPIGRDDRDQNIRWHHEANYDLITVKKPEPGEWRLLADLDPDNQVTVVTDLGLRLAEVPGSIRAHEAVTFSASMTEKGEAVTNADFLSLIKIRLRQADESGRTRAWDFEPDPARPGTFKRTIAEGLKPGKHTFRIIADGRTFQREAEQRIDVVENPVHRTARQGGGPDRTPGSLPKAAADTATPEPGWRTTGLLVAAVNLILLAAGFSLYRVIRRRSARQRMELIERLG